MRISLETYEWDSTWIEKTSETETNRILYIGDSISCGTRTALNAMSSEKFLFDGFGTSKALDNPFYFQSFSLFAKQEGRRDAVLFNNGLHGWHIGETEYEKLYNEFLDKLISEFPNTPIIPVLTTFVTNPDFHNDRVIKRNGIVNKLANSKNLKVIDLYTASEKNRQFQSDDGVHFTDGGYCRLANKIIDFLRTELY